MRRTRTQDPSPMPVKTIAGGLAAVLVAAIGLGLMMKRDRPEPKAEAETAEPEPEVVKETPREEAPAPKQAAAPAKPRGIRWSPFAEGSRTDPKAPPFPLADFKAKREAELKKWRETTVNLSFEDTSIRDIVTEMSRQWGLKIGLDPAVSPDRRLSVSISGLDAAQSMEFLTEFNGLAWVVDGNGESWLVPADKKAMYESKEGSELAALEQTGAQAACDLAPAGPTAEDLELEKKLDAVRISPDLKAVQIFEATRWLWENAQVAVNVDGMAIPEAYKVSLSLVGKDVTIREALASALEPGGYVMYVANGQVQVTTAADLARVKKEAEAAELARRERVATEAEFLLKKVALDGEGLAIRDVAERISKALGVGYRIDPASWSRAARYAFDGEPRTLKEIFEALAKGAPVRVAYRDGMLWYVSTEAP